MHKWWLFSASSVFFSQPTCMLFLLRSTRKRKMQKMPEPHMDLAGSQTNFFYGAPAPYAESIAPSHHSTYAHYFEDEEDEGWEMPNFYNETYMQGIWIAYVSHI